MLKTALIYPALKNGSAKLKESKESFPLLE